MRSLRLCGRVFAVVAAAAALAATAFGQVNLPGESLGGPLTGAPVLAAPFSADATTTVRATLGDGTRLDQSTTDHYFRDSAGRIRVERTMDGLPAAATMSERHLRTIIAPDPTSRLVYTIDAQTQTARHASRAILAMTMGGGRSFSVPVGGIQFVAFQRAGDLLSEDPSGLPLLRDEPLGNQRIAGVETTGHRITIVVPAGYLGNGKPLEVTDERWESAELELLIQSRHSDARTVIEYRLSNIRREEPPAQLFEVPAGYTVDNIQEPRMSFVLAENFRAERAR